MLLHVPGGIRAQETHFWQWFYFLHLHPSLSFLARIIPVFVPFLSPMRSQESQPILNYTKLVLKVPRHTWGERNAFFGCLCLLRVSPAHIQRPGMVALCCFGLGRLICACRAWSCWYCCLWETSFSGQSYFLGMTFSFLNHWVLRSYFVLLYLGGTEQQALRSEPGMIDECRVHSSVQRPIHLLLLKGNYY